MEELEAKQILQDLAPYVKPHKMLYVCEVCAKQLYKWFFVTKFFQGFPRVRFCGKDCRGNRLKGREHVSKTHLAPA